MKNMFWLLIVSYVLICLVLSQLGRMNMIFSSTVVIFHQVSTLFICTIPLSANTLRRTIFSSIQTCTRNQTRGWMALVLPPMLCTRLYGIKVTFVEAISRETWNSKQSQQQSTDSIYLLIYHRKYAMSFSIMNLNIKKRRHYARDSNSALKKLMSS